MRVITACTIAAAVFVASAPDLGAQTTARGMYASLQKREQATRRALDAGKPAKTVRRDVQRIVVGYEGLVARFPRNGYSDNALWQAAFLAADSFARYRVEEDRETSVRLLRRLAASYPTSPLVKRSEPALKRLVAAAPTAATHTMAATAPPLVPVPVLAAPPLPPPAPKPAAADKAERVDSAVPRTVSATTGSGLARIQAIRRTVLPDIVRIAIELDQETEYQVRAHRGTGAGVSRPGGDRARSGGVHQHFV